MKIKYLLFYLSINLIIKKRGEKNQYTCPASVSDSLCLGLQSLDYT